MTRNRTRNFLALVTLILMIAAVNTVVQAQTFSVMYNFGSSSVDPQYPQSPGVIAQGRDGNLYSTTQAGGLYAHGTVFKIPPKGTLAVPYNFNAPQPDADTGLTLGTDGNFYGATQSGGGTECGGIGCGVVFKVTPRGKLTVLHTFTNTGDGANPEAPPILGTDGSFYGTTTQGSGGGNGTVYKMTSSGKLTTIYAFDSTHGSFPSAALVQGTDGNFFGSARTGGASGDGVVFKITPAGKLTVLYDFDLTHGAEPVGPLVQGSNGNFYGTTDGGGHQNGGLVFKITPKGKLSVLHFMKGGTEGANPVAGLVLASDGNFYGANQFGGTGYGTLFRISPKGVFSALHSFDQDNGDTPLATLVQHTNGILYGTTRFGGSGTNCGPGGCGTFFRLKADLKPFVSLVSTSGKVGKTIQILGQGFTGTTGVSFNGTAAKFKVVSGTYLTAIVPTGATTGFVTVTTPKRVLKSNRRFRVMS